MISTANLTVASSKAVASWPLCTYLHRSWFRPSAEDVSAFHRTQKRTSVTQGK